MEYMHARYCNSSLVTYSHDLSTKPLRTDSSIHNRRMHVNQLSDYCWGGGWFCICCACIISPILFVAFTYFPTQRSAHTWHYFPLKHGPSQHTDCTSRKVTWSSHQIAALRFKRTTNWGQSTQKNFEIEKSELSWRRKTEIKAGNDHSHSPVFNSLSWNLGTHFLKHVSVILRRGKRLDTRWRRRSSELEKQHPATLDPICSSVLIKQVSVEGHLCTHHVDMRRSARIHVHDGVFFSFFGCQQDSKKEQLVQNRALVDEGSCCTSTQQQKLQ